MASNGGWIPVLYADIVRKLKKKSVSPYLKA